MFFAVITLFPEMFEAITAYGIGGRAAKRDIVQVTCINPRDFAEETTEEWMNVHLVAAQVW